MTRMFGLTAVCAAVFALAACGPGNTAPPGNSGTGNTPVANNGGGNDTVENGNGGDSRFNAVDSRKAQVQAAWTYLKTQYNKPPSQDDPRGLMSGWGAKSMNVPYTAMVLQGLAGTDVWKSDDAMITDSVKWLLDVQEPTGAWSYMPGVDSLRGIRAVYITSIMAQLLSDLNKLDAWKGKLDNNIARAVDYLKQSQVGNPEGPAGDYDEKSVGFGGWAYSKEEIDDSVKARGKPPANMSTTSFAIDALHACGISEDDPLWQDALTFLKRNQNAGEVQDEGFEAFAKVKNADGATEEKKLKMAGRGSKDYGGAIYSEETSMADGYDTNEDGTVTLYSYGSMTYNLLRSFLFAGLKKDSIPVKLAWGWIQNNYTVERVPGFRKPEQYDMGLYYYYMSMAKTLDAFGADVVAEPERGLEHDWRLDLIKELESRQKDDGSWINDNHDRWQENSKVLCTAYALMALKHTSP